jgi:homoserine O-acetyltransferase
MKNGVPFASEFAVQGYLEAQAAKFVTAFDANCYLYLSRSIDRFDLGKHGDHVEVLRRAQLEQALVIGVETDLLFSIAEQRAIARSFDEAGVTTYFRPLSCIEGHDSFLIDVERFGREIQSFLNRVTVSRS